MGKLESWLGRQLQALRPRFKIAEAVRQGLADLRSRNEDALELDNNSLRGEVAQLRHIIEVLKDREWLEPPRPVRPEPDPSFGYPMGNIPGEAEKALVAEINSMKRQLAAKDGENRQLVTRLQVLSTQLLNISQFNKHGADRAKLEELLIDALRTTHLGIVKPIPAGRPPIRPLSNAEMDAQMKAQAISFDDDQSAIRPAIIPTQLTSNNKLPFKYWNGRT